MGSAEAPPIDRRIVRAAESLAEHGAYLFFLRNAHFLDLLVPEQRLRLQGLPELSDPQVERLVVKTLPGRLPDLASGIYFPVPLSRALDAGRTFAEAVESYRYELVHVDDNQVWWWQQRRVATRTQKFFAQHLAYEPALDLYLFEYRVNEDWWDKCYLDADVTPMLARRLSHDNGQLRVELNNDRWDGVAEDSFHLDGRERLFCRSHSHGEVLFSDWARFELLKGLSEDCQSLRIGERMVPLHWPP